MGIKERLKNLNYGIERNARLLCTLSLLFPIVMLVCAPLYKRSCRWLTEDHPIRALLIVLLVLAISWASHSLEIGLAGPTFWAWCMVLTIMAFLWIAIAELLGFELYDWGKDLANVAIIMFFPVILIFARRWPKEIK